ncbi:MAG: hypothetical protein ACTSU5_02675, partial [Promethearchaeota archaeon]
MLPEFPVERGAEPLQIPTKSSFDKGTIPVQEYDVVEFNGTGPVGENKSIIYQFGDAEAGAYYSVSADTVKNYSVHHTTGFNVTLPTEYYKYWNLSYVNYFNKSSTIKEEMNEYYLQSNQTGEEYLATPVTASLSTPNATDIREFVSPYFNTSAVRLHFSTVQLQAGDLLYAYNGSMDLENPVSNITAPGWTDWLNTSNAFITLNASLASGTRGYTVDRAQYRGVTFNHTGTSQLTVEVDPDVIGFNLTLFNLSLPNNARFVMSDPEGYNITELWRYDGFNTNYTYVNGNETWGPSQWINPDYVVLKMYCLPGDEAACGLNVSAIIYNTTTGWQNYYLAGDNYGDSFGDFIEYVPFTQNVTVNFTRMCGLTTWGPELLDCYSSWTFIFEKRPYEVNLTVVELDGVNGPKVLSGPYVLQSGLAYNFSFNLTDSVEHLPVDWYGWTGDPPNNVSLKVWQYKSLLHCETHPINNGIVNFTLLADWGVTNGTRAGNFDILLQVNDTNFVVLDNTSARATWDMTFKEHPSLELNKLRCEYFSEQTGSWEKKASAVAITTGTLYDPNTVEFNVSALDIHGDSEPLNGQPVNVTVTFDGAVKFTGTIYQNYHWQDSSNYALFNYSFDEVGAWSVTFRLENSSTGEPLGYYFPTSPLTVNVTTYPREYLLDVYNGSGGIQPGQRTELFANITDTEEVDLDGTHYPLGDWKVDFYFLRFVGYQWRQYYIATTYTNNTGIAKVNWIPPEDLMG